MTIKSIQSPGSSHSGSPTGLNSFSSEKLANTNSMYSPVSSLATNGQALQVAQSQSERSSLGLNGHHLNPWASGVTSTAADWYPQMGQYPQYPYSNAAIHDPYQNQVKNKFNSHDGGWSLWRPSSVKSILLEIVSMIPLHIFSLLFFVSFLHLLLKSKSKKKYFARTKNLRSTADFQF